MNKTVGFLGCGNIATAMSQGMVQAELVAPENLYLYDTYEPSALALQEKTGGQILENAQQVAALSDYLILAVKPYVYPSLLEEIKGSVKDGAVVVVIAVGISFDDVKQVLGEKVKVVRVQPSTPALVGESDSTLCPDNLISEDEMTELIELLESFGKAEVLSEKLMNVVPAIASSAPAYGLMLIEAMADGGVYHGFPRDQAIRLSAQAILGAAKMVLETGEHPASLKDKICTPGGTTIEAVKTLEDKGFRKAVISAVEACAEKSKAMMSQK